MQVLEINKPLPPPCVGKRAVGVGMFFGGVQDPDRARMRGIKCILRLEIKLVYTTVLLNSLT